MTKHRHIWLTVVLTTLLLCAPSVLACDCEPPNQQDVFSHSSAVFIGEVVGIADSDVPLFKDLKPGPKSSYAVTFKVIDHWKGVRGSKIIVHSDLGGLPCHQFAFRKGEKYLVYAEGKHFIAITGCTRSRIVENSDYYRSELRGLGPSKKQIGRASCRERV